MAHELGWHGAWQFAEQEAAAGRGTLLERMKAIADDAPQSVKDAIDARYKGRPPEELREEYGAELMGRRGGEAIREAIKTLEGRAWYNRAWQAIKDAIRGMMARMGFNRADLSQIDKLSPDETMDWLVKQMVEGRTLGRVKEQKTSSAADGASKVSHPHMASIQTKEGAMPSRTTAESIAKAVKERKGAENALGDYAAQEKAPNPHRLVSDLGRALGMSRKAPSLYRAFTNDDGTIFSVRLSNHRANADNYLRKANDGLVNISIAVIRGRTGEFKPNDKVELREYEYRERDLTSDDAKKIAVALKDAIANGGNYTDTTGKLVTVNSSPSTQNTTTTTSAITPATDSTTRESRAPAEDAAYMDAVKRGDMETAQRMVREAASKAMPNTKVVDADGKPMKIYHGSRTGANIKIFKTPTFFSDNRDVADIFKKEADFILRVNGKEVAIDNITARQIADELTKGDYTPDEMADWGSFAESIKDIKDNGKSYGGRDVISDALAGVGIDIPLDEITEMSFKRVPDIYECYINIEKPLEIDFKGKTWGQEGTMEMEAAVRDAAKNGYDGVIVRNIREGGFLGELRNGEEPPLSTDYIPINPSQIKSSEVTRDDAGNVIPLSKRFNQQREDIRYSRAPAAPGTPIMDEKRTAGEKAREKFLDSDAPFKDLQDEVGGVKEVVRADGYTDHRTSTDFVAAKDKYNGRLEHEMRGLQRRVDEVNADLDAARLDAQKSDAGTEELLKDFNLFLAAEHAAERNRTHATENGAAYTPDYYKGMGKVEYGGADCT